MENAMETHKNSSRLDALGWLFLLLGIFSVLWYAPQRVPYVFWLCNHAMIIAGIAVLRRNRFWLTAMLSWSLIPVSLWVIDFAGKTVFDKYVLHITEYMFTEPWWAHLPSFQHLISVPLMLYALLLLGAPHERAWLGTAAHAAIAWAISFFLITPDYNVNCAHHACISWMQFPGYAIAWPIIAILLFFLTNKLLVLLFSARKTG